MPDAKAKLTGKIYPNGPPSEANSARSAYRTARNENSFQRQHSLSTIATGLGDYLENVGLTMTPQKPAYFDAFWDDVRREAEAIPLAPEIVAEPLRTTNDVSVFRVRFTSLDHIRIAGWYCRPTEFSGTLPALLTVPGYQAETRIPSDWAQRGYAVLNVAVRGKLGSNDQRRERFFKGGPMGIYFSRPGYSNGSSWV